MYNRKTITGLPPNYSARQTVYSDFVPGLDGSFVLGDSAQRWKWLYTIGATVYTTLIVGGTLQSRDIDAFGDIQVQTDPLTGTGGNVVCDESVACKTMSTTHNITCGGNFSAVGGVSSATAAIVGLLTSGSLNTGPITCSTVAANSLAVTAGATCATLTASDNVTSPSVSATTSLQLSNQTAIRKIMTVSHLVGSGTSGVNTVTINFPTSVVSAKTTVQITPCVPPNSADMFVTVARAVGTSSVVVNILCSVPSGAAWTTNLTLHLLIIELL
jgi:hypothetical protein